MNWLIVASCYVTAAIGYQLVSVTHCTSCWVTNPTNRDDHCHLTSQLTSVLLSLSWSLSLSLISSWMHQYLSNANVDRSLKRVARSFDRSNTQSFSINSTPIPRAPKLESVTSATIPCVTFSSHVKSHVSRSELHIWDCTGHRRFQDTQWVEVRQDMEFCEFTS